MLGEVNNAAVVLGFGHGLEMKGGVIQDNQGEGLEKWLRPKVLTYYVQNRI